MKRAKLYYLRERKGKSARIAEKIKKKIGVDVSEQIVENQPTADDVIKKEEVKKETVKVETPKTESSKVEKKKETPNQATKKEELKTKKK